MEIVSDSVDEDFPKFHVIRIITFTFLLLELGLDVQEPDITVILSDKVWNFTSGEDHVHELKEVLMSNFLISQKE